MNTIFPATSPKPYSFICEATVATVHESQSTESEADLALQKAELLKAQAKIQKEVAMWSSYMEKAEDFKRSAKGLEAEATDRQRAAQRAAVEKAQETIFPVRDVAEANHGVTFAEACLQQFLDAKSISHGNAYHIYWLNASVLGYDSVQGAQIAIPLCATLVAENPAKRVIVVAAPTCGAYGNDAHLHMVSSKP